MFNLPKNKYNRLAFELLIIAGFIFIARNSFNKLFFVNLSQLSYTALIVAIFLVVIFKPKSKLNFFLFQKILKYFSIKEKYKIKIKTVLFVLPALAIIIANLYIIPLYLNNKIPLSQIFFHEYNLSSKIISVYILYLLLIILFFSLGQRIINFFKIDFPQKLDYFIFSWGIGLGIFSLFIFLIAVGKALYLKTILILVALIITASFSEIRKTFKTINQTAFTFSFQTPFQSWRSFVILLLTVLLTVNFVLGIKPVPLESDSLNLYFNAPWLYSQSHRYVKFLNEETMGENIEMIYASILTIAGAPFIVHLSWLFFVFTLLAFYLLANYIFGKNYALYSLPILYFIPWNSFFIYAQKIEMALLFYLSLILYLFFLWQKTNNKKYLYLLGALSGISLGVKYTAALFLLPLYILITFFILKNFSFLKLKHLSYSFFLVIVFFSPWLIKNQLLYQKPLNPYSFRDNAPTPFLNCNLAISQRINKEISQFYFYKNENGAINKLFLPTLFNQYLNFQKTISTKDPKRMVNFGITPLFIFWVFFLFLKNKKTATILFLIVFYFEFWHLAPLGARPWYAFFGIYLTYFLTPFLLLNKDQKRSFYYSALYFLIILPPALSYLLSPANDNFFYLTGLENEKTYQTKHLVFYKTGQFINNLSLQKPEKILIAEFNGLYPIKNNNEIAVNDTHLTKIGCALDEGDSYFYKLLKKNSIKYIIINKRFHLTKIKPEYLKQYTQKYKFIETRLKLYNFVQKYGQKIYENSYFIVYQIYK